MRRLVHLFRSKAKLVDELHAKRQEAETLWSDVLTALKRIDNLSDACHGLRLQTEELTRQLDATKNDCACTVADVGYLKEQLRVQRGLVRHWYGQAAVRDVYIRDVERLYDTEDLMAEFEA